ncbi:MAG: serine hydrolase [Anaerolineae bacterium]|nr:serine hydrolase [Anaerolineae bacterium]
MRKLLFLIFFIWFITITGASADSPALTYTTQLEDTLPRLADKYYRDPADWPAIWRATNNAAATDSRFAAIDSPGVLLPGQMLVIPTKAEASRLLAGGGTTEPSLVAAPEVQPLTPEWLANFSTTVEETRQHFGIPGVAVAIVRDNQIVLAEGFGVRELGRDEPITSQTVFAVGSTTKAMNAAMIASLVDDGVLAWDQPVRDLWPDFALADPDLTSEIRLRDLLNMSSGVLRADLEWSGVGLTPEQTMASLAELPLDEEPGRHFHYNNQIVATAGYVAALAAGGATGNLDAAYADLLRLRLFEPAGMKTASLFVDAAQANPNHATPHDFTLFGEVVPTYYHADTGITPAGAVNASAVDLARFLLMQLNQGVSQTGTRVVSAENLTEAWQPQIEITPDFNYGMGWFIEEYEGVEMLWHDGDVLGFKSLLVMVPEANAGMVLLTNRTISFGFANSLRYRFIELLYDLDVEAAEYYKTQWDDFMEALPGIREPLAETVSEAEVADYVGEYETGWQVERREDGTFWTTRGPYQWRLLAAGEGKFVINNGFGITSEIVFEPDETDQMQMAVWLSNGETGTYLRLEP